MSVVRLVYCSKAANPVGEELVDELLNVSTRNNKSNRVTGMLYYNSGYFLQFIEGDYRQINDLYRLINNDSRHLHITLLLYGVSDRRLMPNWSMAYLRDDMYLNELIRRYAEQDGQMDIDLVGQACIDYMASLDSIN